MEYLHHYITTASAKMEQHLVEQVENIIGYVFLNKCLLEQALTHSSFTKGVSYKRLDFIEDYILSLAITTHLFLIYPNLQLGQLSFLCAANTNTEKLACVTVHYNLHHFIRHNTRPLIDQVGRFVDAIAKENHPIVHGGSVKAPKVLADIIKSIIGAIYVDLKFDIETTRMVIRHVFESIVTLDDLEQLLQLVTTLFHICQKKGMHVDIKQWRNGDVSIANVYIDEQFVVSASSAQKHLAKLEASKIALHKLECSVPTNMKSPTNMKLSFYIDKDGTSVVVEAKRRLHQLCQIKRWPKPKYMVVKNSSPTHQKRYVCTVRITTEDGILQMLGYEKSQVTDAENSATSLMLLSLKERNQLIIFE